ncbi:MAG: hypothetical protein LUQ37_06615 [Methanoregulaceae archaeon]|nr:hypothetical protein [Methanoregulaceae archaeon]
MKRILQRCNSGWLLWALASRSKGSDQAAVGLREPGRRSGGGESHILGYDHLPTSPNLCRRYFAPCGSRHHERQLQEDRAGDGTSG